MKILPPVRVNARIGRARSMWDLVLRYGAAYSCTLIAVAAAQLIIRSDVAWGLALLTLLGLPLSLWLRSTGLRFGDRKIPRPIINSLMMLVTGLVTAVVLTTVPGFRFDRLFQLVYATLTIQVLMEVFLVLSVCRCLAIINDKDAVLCTVPSFSVLLLLIVVHKGPEVVVYFLLWATMAALLLALDQRAEARRGIAARVPPVIPNQEIKLSSRSLAGVMAFSLTCAVVLSYSVSGDEDKRNDNWVTRLFTRASAIGGEVQDVSVNSGPERQIDFNSGPVLPTRTALWRVVAYDRNGRRPLRPQYWRMFTYARYDGLSWSQLPGQGAAIPFQMLSPEKSLPRSSFNPARQPIDNGYDVAEKAPDAGRARFFGTPRSQIYCQVRALVTNTGFVPTLPGVQVLVPQMDKPPEALRARDDGALDIGVLNQNEPLRSMSEVVAAAEYDTLDAARQNRALPEEGDTEDEDNAGQNDNEDKSSNPDLGPPVKRLTVAQPQLQLSREDRAFYLQLPSRLPARVREWAKSVVDAASEDDSDYTRARLLSAAVQRSASYTLRPPLVPENRDATDFFLFGSRRGYCTYFAGALAVTCRAVGIPARVVTGFTNPEWENEFDSEATLREAGSHAWTEIWVPNWGWAMLDATPPASRGYNSPTLFQNWQEFCDNALQAVSQNLQKNRVAYTTLFALLALAFIAAWWSQRRRAWRHAHALHLKAEEREDFLARREIYALYRRTARQLARRYRPGAAWETPLEWLNAAEIALQLRDSEPLRRLVRLYVHAHYSPRPLSQRELNDARQAWQALNWESVKAK